MVKNLLAMQEPQEMLVQPLGGKDPLQESMATPSSILAWRIPWTEERGRLQSIGSQRVGHDRRDLAHMHQRKQTAFIWYACMIIQMHFLKELPNEENTPSMVTEKQFYVAGFRIISRH